MDDTALRWRRECWRGDTSFWGAKTFVPSEFLGEKVLGDEVSRFFLLKTKALKMFLPATKCYPHMHICTNSKITFLEFYEYCTCY